MLPNIEIKSVWGVRRVTVEALPTAPRGVKFAGGYRPAFEDIEHLLTDWPIRCQEPLQGPRNGAPDERAGH